MLSYRLYRLDGASKISSAEWIHAADDAEAKRAAGVRSESGNYELWDRNRLVARTGRPRT